MNLTHVLEELDKKNKGWHVVRCGRDVAIMIWACELAKVQRCGNGTNIFQMRLTGKGRKFVREGILLFEE